MKYFRFVCDIKKKLSEVVDATRDSAINEVGIFCAYLSRMYEYYFPRTQTDNVVSITVCLIEENQEMQYPQSCANMIVVSNVIDIDKFKLLAPNEKSSYIIGICQQSICHSFLKCAGILRLLNALIIKSSTRIAFFGIIGEKRNVLPIGN